MSLLARFWSIFTEFLRPKDKISVSLPPTLTFAKQTILITGGTSGLGLEAAVIYAKLGAQNVIITARTAAKGEVAKQEIEGRAGRKDVVSVRVLDMGSFAGVQAFARELKRDVKGIDVVILNAGIHNFHFEELESGWEAGLQVNLLSTVLLGLLLLPWMREVRKEGQIQHLLFVGSGSHFEPDITNGKWPKENVLEFWNQKRNFISGHGQYGNTKLLLQYSIREIAARVTSMSLASSPNPIVNSVCPGMIKTNITRDFHNGNPFYKVLELIFHFLKSHPAEVGGKSLVLATTVGVERHGGFERPYFNDEEYAEKAKTNITSAEGKKMQARVWKEIIEVLKQVEPEVEKTVSL